MRYLARPDLTACLSNYDILQVVAGTPAWAAVTRDTRVPVVLQAATTVSWERRSHTSRGNWPLRKWRAAMTRSTTAFEKVGVNHSDAVMVENAEMQRHVESLGHPKVILAPPGVDIDRFRPEAGKSGRSGYLLSVCRLADPRKGLDRLVRSYAALLRQRSDAPKLIIAGRGTLDDITVNLIGQLRIADRVVVRPDIPDSDLPDLYRGAAVFLQTSYEEGLGLSVLEAMASGIPVVATETAGSRQTVAHGKTGWLVPQDDDMSVPLLISRRVAELLEGRQVDFGAAARLRALERFSTQATLKVFESTYEALLADSGSKHENSCC